MGDWTTAKRFDATQVYGMRIRPNATVHDAISVMYPDLAEMDNVALGRILAASESTLARDVVDPTTLNSHERKFEYVLVYTLITILRSRGINVRER